MGHSKPLQELTWVEVLSIGGNSGSAGSLRLAAACFAAGCFAAAAGFFTPFGFAGALLAATFGAGGFFLTAVALG